MHRNALPRRGVNLPLVRFLPQQVWIKGLSTGISVEIHCARSPIAYGARYSTVGCGGIKPCFSGVKAGHARAARDGLGAACERVNPQIELLLQAHNGILEDLQHLTLHSKRQRCMGCTVSTFVNAQPTDNSVAEAGPHPDCFGAWTGSWSAPMHNTLDDLAAVARNCAQTTVIQPVARRLPDPTAAFRHKTLYRENRYHSTASR